MPTVFVQGPYRFYFFSREEKRRHIHVSGPDGEVKIWLEPNIEVSKIVHMSDTEVNDILEIVKSRKEEIDEFWIKHFSA